MVFLSICALGPSIAEQTGQSMCFVQYPNRGDVVDLFCCIACTQGALMPWEDSTMSPDMKASFEVFKPVLKARRCYQGLQLRIYVCASMYSIVNTPTIGSCSSLQ